MYNLYHHEKKLLDLKKKLKETEKEEKLKGKRKKALEEMSNNYEHRIKEFVYDMANHPTLITDYESPIDNTRKKLIEDENYKIKGKKGFNFNNYKTEKERINDLLKDIGTINSRFNLAYIKNDDYNKTKDKGASKITQANKDDSRELNDDSIDPTVVLKKDSSSLLRKPTLVQPSMRFKPRNDLERIVDSVDQNHHGGVNYRLLQTLRKRFGLKLSKKALDDKTEGGILEEYKYADQLRANDRERDVKGIELLNLYEDGLNKEGYKNKEYYLTVGNSPNRKVFSRKSNINLNQHINSVARKKVENLAAKELLKDLYNKTHFKAATDLAVLNKSSDEYKTGLSTAPRNASTKTKEKNKVLNFKVKSQMQSPKKRESSSDSYISVTMGNRSELLSQQILGKFDHVNNIIIEGNVSDEEILKTNPLFFNMNNNNPLKVRNPTFDEKKLKEVAKLAFPKLVTINEREQARKNKIKQIFGMRKNKILDGEKITNSLRNLRIEGLNIGDIGLKRNDEERIVIDQEVFDRKEVNLIAKKILKKCNYTHNKHENAKDSLKKLNGKLMMTNGMSVKAFKDLYNL